MVLISNYFEHMNWYMKRKLNCDSITCCCYIIKRVMIDQNVPITEDNMKRSFFFDFGKSGFTGWRPFKRFLGTFFAIAQKVRKGHEGLRAVRYKPTVKVH